MKKRIFALCLMIILIVTASGCGKKQVASSDGKMTISWLPQCDSPLDENSPVLKELEEKLNVDFDFIYIDRSKMKELLNVRLASGEIPDVMRITDSATFGTYLDQGIISEIPEDILKSTGKTIYETTIKYGGENIWEYGKSNGKVYGIPILSISAKYSTVPIWRSDWLKKVGIDKVPETLEEAEAAFYAFANNDPDGNNKKDTYGLSDKGMSAVYGAFGIQPDIWQEFDGKIVYSSATPQMKEALMLLNKWYKDGVIDPEFISGENKGQYWANTVAMWNGKIGFSVPGAYYHVNEPTKYSQASANFTNFKQIQGENASYVTAKPFTGKDGKNGTSKSNVFNGNFLTIGRKVKDDPAKMEKIIEINNKLIEDFDLYVLALKGIEGDHYKIEDGRYITTIDTSKDPNIKSKLGLSTNGIGYLLSNQFEYATETQPDKYELAEKIASHNGYATVITGVLPSSAQYMAGINAKIAEARVLFITGEKSFDEWDSYIEELNKAGLDKLTKEANEWYYKYNTK